MSDFPDTFPLAEVATVIKVIRGGPLTTDLREIVRCLWYVAGFVAGQALPASGLTGEAIPQPAARPASITVLECADYLEKCSEARQAGKVGDTTIPWDLILPIVLDLFKQWWSRRQG